MEAERGEAFWPVTPGPEGHSRAELYRGYKRLVNCISEKLHKSEVLSLAYEHDLPAWFIEIGPMHEPGYALRVLSQMEGRQVFSPTNLTDLAQSLNGIGRVDLGNQVKAFQDQHREVMEEMNKTHSASTPEPFMREEASRRSLGNNRRYYLDTFREVKLSQGSVDQIPLMGRPISENHSRHGSMDRCSMDRSREGTPFEAVLDPIDPPLPQDVNLGIEMSKMSAETLGNQLQLVQQMLTSRCVASPYLYQSLTNAYLLTKQIGSLLNVAGDSIKKIPTKSQQLGGNDASDPSPTHSRQNSSGEITTKKNSLGSVGGHSHVLASWEQGMSDVQKDSAFLFRPLINMYRCHSQPQVFYLNQSESMLVPQDKPQVVAISKPVWQGETASRCGDSKVPPDQMSPLENKGDHTLGESSSDAPASNPDLPPPLPPRPTHLQPSPIEGRRIFTERTDRVNSVNSEGNDQLSPVTRNGYHLIRPSKSVEELNNITENRDAVGRTSRTFSRGQEGSYSNWSFRFFSKRKPLA